MFLNLLVALCIILYIACKSCYIILVLSYRIRFMYFFIVTTKHSSKILNVGIWYSERNDRDEMYRGKIIYYLYFHIVTVDN